MGVPTAVRADDPRQQTDESLRTEREKVDAGVAEKRVIVEETTDEVVRIARELADEVVRTTRDAVDLEREADTSSAQVRSEAERAREDLLVERARALADAVLEHERAEQKRILEDFLAVEREATDADLLEERAHADNAVAARDELLANVSHDLRTLLSGLVLHADAMLLKAPGGPVGDDLRKHATSSRRLVARMTRLVNDLVDVSSIEAGKLTIVPDEVGVAKLLQETLDTFKPLAAAKGITISSDVADLPPDARLDGGRILQVLANLLSNALKFTPSGGRVAIRVRAVGREIHFTVSDSGIGIPADALPKVFDRFQQAGRDRRGLGIGLHISKAIVEAHGGRMWAESEAGRGSSFHFALPAR